MVVDTSALTMPNQPPARPLARYLKVARGLEIPVESFGNILRSARTQRGLSIDDVARQTRIPRQTVHAIEAELFERLPAPVFVRGFIRSYARLVSVEPGPLVVQFDAALADEGDRTAPKGRERRRQTRRQATTQVLPLEPAGTREPVSMGVKGGYAVLFAVALGLLIAAWMSMGSRPAPEHDGRQARPTPPSIKSQVDGESSLTVRMSGQARPDGNTSDEGAPEPPGWRSHRAAE